MSNSDLSILFFKFFIEFGLRKKLKKFVKNGCQVEKSMLYYHSCCGSAGIGRQARLRILWVYARVGSSPISRILEKGILPKRVLFLFFMNFCPPCNFFISLHNSHQPAITYRICYIFSQILFESGICDQNRNKGFSWIPCPHVRPCV